jgi:dihydrofolate reductase
MRQIRYAVVASLDGYIAGPNGEIDWIIPNSEIDLAEVFSRFDTILVGRKTFEVMHRAGRETMPGMQTVVFSRTLRPKDHPNITIISKNAHESLSKLRAKPGKDLWLFGGGELFRDLLEAKMVDGIDLAVMPVLLGGGTPLLPPPAARATLKLVKSKTFKAGIVSLEYAVNYSAAENKR